MTPSAPSSRAVISAADLGTNTIKISHAIVGTDGSISELRDSANTIRLGKGIEESGQIEPERIDRCLELLKAEEKIGRQFGSDIFSGVATEAFRVASNGGELLNRIRTETGWQIRLIPGEEEARLTWLGLKDQVPETDNAAIVDIGGGSSEIILIANGEVTFSTSIPLGSGRLADQFFQNDPPGIEALLQASAKARALLDTINGLPNEGDIILFSGGNGVFVQSIVDQLFPDESFSTDTVEKLLVHFSTTPAQDAADRLGIAHERARVLPAGAAIAFAFLTHTHFSTVLGVPSGIRIGLMREFISQQ